MRRVVALVFAIVVTSFFALPAPAGALGQEETSFDRFAGMYEADIPDMGTMAITISFDDESGVLTVAAEAQAATEMEHIKGSRFKIESYEFGTIYFEFLESEEGEITSMAIDGYAFSFIAVRTS